jgi:hypothetical protein
MAAKKNMNRPPTESPSHDTTGTGFHGWSSARGRGGGEGGRGGTDQEYGHGVASPPNGRRMNAARGDAGARRDDARNQRAKATRAPVTRPKKTGPTR